ncbi:16S rRNA pseudouridine516 synthase [Atopomonas hussainii]|uniref:Pseudouridine synthase n=1 Tax=Atopomonas hussainii TaxID=1429083 RepID=A0A1H7LH56_9GAMM|nr:pseudouridine synthase [Atopomonas hussainii]SEK97707.1 16S rRNA pseudouridine516 synthase [Atopomonas hussainii]
MRLDRLLANQSQYSRKQVRELLRAGVVQVNGAVCHDGTQAIDRFAEVAIGTQVVRAGRAAHYFMLHKPAGCVSATADNEHTTVLDFFPEALRSELHIAGRLDLTSTGLMLLTNDGLWSRRLTLPGQRLGKVYRVRTEQPISAETAEVFARGIYFAFENRTTLPAELELLGSHEARLTLHEGRYHQVKRMFGHLRNKVLSLHREQMGMLHLDPELKPGQWRALSAAEIASV